MPPRRVRPARVPPTRVPPTRVADILLRAPAPRLMRLHWPAPGSAPPGPTPPGAAVPGLVVLLTGGSVDVAGALADRVGAVVLAGPGADLGSAHTALAWAADHAAELGADPTRLALIGAAPLVGRVVRRVDEEGWPPLVAVVLEPGDDPAGALLAAGWAR